MELQQSRAARPCCTPGAEACTPAPGPGWLAARPGGTAPCSRSSRLSLPSPTGACVTGTATRVSPGASRPSQAHACSADTMAVISSWFALSVQCTETRTVCLRSLGCRTQAWAAVECCSPWEQNFLLSLRWWLCEPIMAPARQAGGLAALRGPCSPCLLPQPSGPALWSLMLSEQ